VAGSGSASECAPADTGSGDAAIGAESALSALDKVPHPPSARAAIRTTSPAAVPRSTPIRSRRTEGPPLECAYWWTA